MSDFSLFLFRIFVAPRHEMCITFEPGARDPPAPVPPPKQGLRRRAAGERAATESCSIAAAAKNDAPRSMQPSNDNVSLLPSLRGSSNTEAHAQEHRTESTPPGETGYGPDDALSAAAKRGKMKREQKRGLAFFWECRQNTKNAEREREREREGISPSRSLSLAF